MYVLVCLKQLKVILCTSQIKIHKLTPFEDYKEWLQSFDTELNELTNQNKMKSPKVLSKQKRKRYIT